MSDVGYEDYSPTDSDLAGTVNRKGLAHVIAQSPVLPLLQLDNRHFEVLAALILRAQAGFATFYDNVSLLPTGSDKGRDILLRRGAVTGIVQCKRKAQKMGRDDILTEILRMALYAARDTTIRPAPGTRYQLWTASGLQDRARTLIDDADTATIMRAELPALFAQARAGIVSLRQYPDAEQDAAEQAQAIAIAAGLKLEHVGPEAIAGDLAQLPAVRRLFFRSPEDAPPSASVVQLDDLVARLREDQLARLRAAGRFGVQPYVSRPALDHEFEGFLQDPGRAFVAIGGSGQGKTSWVARLLDTPPGGYTTIMIPAERIARSDRTPVDTIARLLTERPLGTVPLDRIDQAIWDWLDAGNRILAVDGLDRVPSDARGTLPEWLEASADLTRRASVRVVLTSRRESWQWLVDQVPAIQTAMYTSEDTADEKASVVLAALSGTEAEQVYEAYGVTVAQHRGARLSTPSLIALFSQIRANLPSVVTRLEILEAEKLRIERELRTRGIGPLVVKSGMDWLGDRLLESEDGWIPTDGAASSTAVVEALIEADWLIQRERSVRLDMDDLAELLLAQRLCLERLLAELGAGRRDPIFIGGAALLVAMRETEGGTGAILGALLDAAPRGRSRWLDVAAAAILELQFPEGVLDRMQQAIGLWDGLNMFLVASVLGTMINHVDLPGRDRLDLILPLADGEDADDWRDKYWRGNQAGRIVSPFTTAAESAVDADPEKSLGAILGLFETESSVRIAIGRTLLFRATRRSPASALAAAWSQIRNAPDTFNVALHAAPAAAARFLAGVDLESRAMTRFVLNRLWVIAQSEEIEDGGPEAAKMIRDAADHLLTRITDPGLRAFLLIIRLRAERSSELQEQLRAHWSLVDDENYWPAVSALGDRMEDRLTHLLAGGEPGRDVNQILKALAVNRVAALDPASLKEPLLAFAKGNAEQMRAVVAAVEAMLYGQPECGSPMLEEVAGVLARSSDDYARAQLTYYAGSASHHDPHPWEINQRERLLRILIDHETGENLSLLTWKIIESAPERPEPQRHLDTLARRFGAARLRDAIGFFAGLPGAEGLNLDFEGP